MQKRLSWVDVCRGIGILLVIYGHGLNGYSLRYLIYAFHMPLFFFLSGIVFHHKQYEHFRTYLKKDIKRILIPYIIFAIIGLLVWFALLPDKDRTSSVFLYQLFTIFYGNGSGNGLAFNNLLWFLPCLFVTRLGFWLVTAFIKSKKGIAVALGAFSIIGYGISHFFPNLALPFGTEVACTAVVFFGLGYLWNDSSEHVKTWFADHATYIFPSLLVICMTTAVIMHQWYGRQIDLRLNELQNYGLFYLASLSGIFSCLAVSMLIHKNRILEYLGRHSMPLFVWHLIIFSYLTDIVLLFIDERQISELHNTILAPLYTVISIVLIVVVLKTFTKKNILSVLRAELIPQSLKKLLFERSGELVSESSPE